MNFLDRELKFGMYRDNRLEDGEYEVTIKSILPTDKKAQSLEGENEIALFTFNVDGESPFSKYIILDFRVNSILHKLHLSIFGEKTVKLSQFIGKSCTITIRNEPSKDGKNTYSNIVDVFPIESEDSEIDQDIESNLDENLEEDLDGMESNSTDDEFEDIDSIDDEPTPKPSAYQPLGFNGRRKRNIKLR